MLTSKDFADKIGVEPARVRKLCIAGRVKGAIKHGRDWMIPTNATVQKVRQGRPPLNQKGK